MLCSPDSVREKLGKSRSRSAQKSVGPYVTTLREGCRTHEKHIIRRKQNSGRDSRKLSKFERWKGSDAEERVATDQNLPLAKLFVSVEHGGQISIPDPDRDSPRRD